MKIFYIYLIFITFSTHAQTFDWLQSATYSSETQGDWVGIDITGNLYVAGTCFNSDHGSVANRANAFLSKYSPDGNLLWTDTLIGVKTIKCDIDSIGNVYATGKFLNTATFNGQSLFNNSQYNNGYIVKYEPNGNCIYARNLSNICPKNIKLIKQGGYILTGVAPLGQYSVSLNNVNFDKRGFFLAKFDTNDSCIWGVGTDGVNYSYGDKFVVDKLGNCYVSGHFYNSITIGDTGNPKTLSSSFFHNNFLCKYNVSGELLWAKSFAPLTYQSDMYFKSVAVDDNNSTYLSGTFMGDIFFDGKTASHNTITEANLIIKYDSAGVLSWFKIIGDSSGWIETNDLEYINSSVYVTGSFRNTIDFGGQTVALGSNYNQLFIAKYDTAFNLQWVKNSVGLIGLSGFQDGSARATSFFVRGNTIGITGAVSKKVDFGGIIYNSDGYYDMFVLKFSDTTTVTNISNVFSSQNKFSVYPNPNQGIFTIQLSTEKKEKLLLTIVDAKGQQVYSETISDFQGELKKEIDLSRNAKGIYFIQIQNSEGTRTKKIVLE